MDSFRHKAGLHPNSFAALLSQWNSGCNRRTSSACVVFPPWFSRQHPTNFHQSPTDVVAKPKSTSLGAAVVARNVFVWHAHKPRPFRPSQDADWPIFWRTVFLCVFKRSSVTRVQLVTSLGDCFQVLLSSTAIKYCYQVLLSSTASPPRGTVHLEANSDKPHLRNPQGPSHYLCGNCFKGNTIV